MSKYIIKAVYSQKETNDLTVANTLAFKRTDLVNKGSDKDKVEHANKFLLKGFKIDLDEYLEYRKVYK